MKAKFTEQSGSYVGKAAVIAHFVARIKSASGVKMTAIKAVNAISAKNAQGVLTM